MIAFPSRGLYAITQCHNKRVDAVLTEAAAAIRGGAAVLQYRDKNPENALYLARELRKICHQQAVPLIINDDVDLAIQSNADGVHLGRDDDDIVNARLRMPKGAIIGVSCYNSVERAMAAQKQGASYVAFGRFFPSLSKPLAAPAEIATLLQAKASLQIPIVAIGGILPHNGGQLRSAGADLLGVIGGIFDQNPEASALAYQHLFAD